MKKKILWGIIILLGLFLILHGFLGKNARQRQTGDVFYLKQTESANALYKAKATTKDEMLIYTHEGKGECKNENILGYYYNQEDGLVYFVVLKKDDAGEDAFGQYSIKPGDTQPQFIEYTPDFDGKGPYSEAKVQLSKDGKTLYNDGGNLCLREGDREKVLKKYAGIYNKETSPGYVPIGILPDGNYALYHPKSGGWKWLRQVNEFFTQLIFRKSVGDDIYIVDLRDNTSSSYLKDAYDFQFVS